MAYLFASQSNVDNYTVDYSSSNYIPYYENNHQGIFTQRAYHNILQGVVEARMETRGEIIQLGTTTRQGTIFPGGYYTPNRILLGMTVLSGTSTVSSVHKVLDAWSYTSTNANDSYKVNLYAKNDLLLSSEIGSILMYDGSTNFATLDKTSTKFFCTDFEFASAINSGYALMSFGDSSTATNNWHIGSEGNGDFNFYNGNRGSGALKMKLQSDGVLVLTNNGTKYLQGGDDVSFHDINVANTLGIYGVQNSTIANIKLGSGGGTVISSAGAIGSANLAGNAGSVSVDANGYFTRTSSDITLKEKIETLSGSLELVEKMRPVKYNWKNTGSFGSQREVGFIAQEMELVVPEVIGTSLDGIKSLEYSKLVAVMAGAIQELSQKIKYLESLITGSV